MSFGNGGWNWTPCQSNPQGHGQPLNNTQVISMDWRDILGSAQGQTGVTSATSPFVFPRDSSPQGGVYTGKGIRQEVEGQAPATFRIAVGNRQDLGQFLSQPQTFDGDGDQLGQNEGYGSQVNSQPRMVLLPEVKGPMYQPCGTCEGCSFKPKGQKGSNFLCRTRGSRSTQ